MRVATQRAEATGHSAPSGGNIGVQRRGRAAAGMGECTAKVVARIAVPEAGRGVFRRTQMETIMIAQRSAAHRKRARDITKQHKAGRAVGGRGGEEKERFVSQKRGKKERALH